MKHLVLILATFLTLSGFSQPIPDFLILLCQADSVDKLTSLNELDTTLMRQVYIEWKVGEQETLKFWNRETFISFDGLMKGHSLIGGHKYKEENNLWGYSVHRRYNEVHHETILLISRGGNVVVVTDDRLTSSHEYNVFYSPKLIPENIEQAYLDKFGNFFY